MSSELTLDIQLTELGFSSWDFQLLEQKEKHPASEVEHDASSSLLCPLSAKPHVDEEADVSLSQATPVVCQNSPSDHDSGIIGSAEKSSKRAHFKNNKHTGGKRRKSSEEEEDDDDEPVKEDKKKKKLNEQGSTKRKFSKTEVCEEEEEEEEDGSDEDGDHYDLTDDEEENDNLSSDTSGSEEHQCPVCSLTFSTTFLLQEHLHIHNGVRRYSCAECGKQFCHSKNYRNHLRSHDKVDTVKCIICTAPFATQADLQLHLDTNHLEDQFYQCDFCKRIFTSMEECQKHVRTHTRHPKGYPCPKCERSFRHRSSMLYHLKRHKKATLVCKDCGMAFSKKVGLLRHSFSHLGLPPFTCVRCKQHFRLGSQFRKHECKAEQLQCVACLVTFQSKEDFEKHKKDTGCWGHQTAPSDVATDIRCMECGQVFESSEELKKHAGTHQRVMRCSECGMGFRSSFMLMSHMGGHAAQRPVLCKECGLGFCHQQGYDSHLKTCGLVNPAEAAMKKSKPKVVSTSEKKGIPTVPSHKSKVVEPSTVEVPKTNSIHPVIPVGSQIKTPDPPLNVTLNKDPISPVSLVMFMPVPLTPSSESIPDAKNPVLAPHATELSVASTSSAPNTELPQDNASSSSSKILIPLSTENDTKKRWTVLDLPTSGPVSKTYTVYTVKKENEITVAAKLLSVGKVNAENAQKNVLSSQQILDILNIIKKKQGPDEKNANLHTVVIPAKYCENDIQGVSGLEAKKSIETSGDNQSTTVGKDTLGAEKINFHNPDFGFSGMGPEVLRIKEESEYCEDSKSLIHWLPELSSLKPEKTVQKVTEEEDSWSKNIPEPDVVQCEICGKMLLEKDLSEHNLEH
ncbi:zinc finger protein 37 [Trichomycterus rosablanca]|uniref:zinc finger protein 37 n=1 Tax=Trichomycterus rosablanca TaxID=2290929 RepID=UPI002F35BC6C